MKSGEVAKRFKIDPKTVKAWVAEYPEFFSKGAKGEVEGQLQVTFEPADLVTLNTIRVERSLKSDKETIRAKLAAGERHESLPPEFTTIEGDNAIVVYTQLKALEVRVQTLQEEVERLRGVEQSKEQTIAELNREVGKWQARYEILKEQLENKD